MSGVEAAAAARLPRAAEELGSILARLSSDAGPALERLIDGCARALEAGGKILFAGNGGSAAQCQHLATELACRFTTDRAPYAALSLTTDTSFLTACTNDYGFEHVFARQVEALGRTGDVLVLLSTGGQSPNVLRAAEAARCRGLAVFGLAGEAGELADFCDVAIRVPSRDPARIQEAHLLLGHLLCEGVERRLGGSQPS